MDKDTTFQYLDPRGGSNRYSINTDFFKSWSDVMAYVLGFLYADGSIIDAKSSRTQYVKFISKDQDIVEAIRLLLEAEHPIYVRPPQQVLYQNGKIYTSSELFYFKIGSRRMFVDLLKLGLTPRKSKTIKFPDFIPQRYLNHFVRGYFDGDGCVAIGNRRRKAQPVALKRLGIIFTSGSRIFLEDLGSNLKEILMLKQSNVYCSNRAYQIHYSTSDSIELFKFLYRDVSKSTCLKRKLGVFLEYFQSQSSKVDKAVKQILDSLNFGLVPK